MVHFEMNRLQHRFCDWWHSAAKKSWVICDNDHNCRTFHVQVELTPLTHRLTLKLKLLASDRFEILAVMDGVKCPAEDFIVRGEKSTGAHRTGLLKQLQRIAEYGFQGVPVAWLHEASKEEKIYELIKGPLRLFFFHGLGSQIVICVDGTRKKAGKADGASVSRAAKCRSAYLAAHANSTLEVS